MKKKLLIIAPHPDDEVLGCGGTIKKKISQGHEVSVLIATNANKSMPERYTLDKLDKIRQAALNAHDLLGIHETIFEDFPAPMLDQHPLSKMAESIHNIISDKKYDTVYVPHRGDIHNDHKVIFDATLVACRPVGDYSVRKILAYETLSETEWAHPYASDAFIPTVFETLSKEAFQLKLNAMERYDSQLRSFPASRSLEALEALAKYRGSTINVERAEAFMLIREIH
jgi:LmbE family N-acetylglucosaminyl deacetylase